MDENTELMVWKIQQLSAEEQRRKNEAYNQSIEEQIYNVAQPHQQMQGYPQQIQQISECNRGHNFETNKLLIHNKCKVDTRKNHHFRQYR